MDKSMMPLFLSFLLFFQGCGYFEKGENFVFDIVDASKVESKSIKLKKVYANQRMEVLKNTLDDTCILGIMKIPPKVVGRLYDIEFFSDSISYTYFPYMATSGNLVIKHSFY